MYAAHFTVVFDRWLDDLHDSRAQDRIAARLLRMENGDLGNAKFFDRIGELRIGYGPGYRLYFVRREAVVIVLLCGGDKSSQSSDFRRAIALAQEV